jgi:type I thyroxine 5'-deiodinase
VYIKEIHSTDGWQVEENVQDGVLVRDHRSLEERIEVGQTCMLKMALELPAVVDEMDDAAAAAYAAMPERLYLIERGGQIAYQGGMGPMFFRPEEWETAIESLLNSLWDSVARG